MAIRGPLRELGIHDVFQLLDLSRKTGVLKVTSELRQNEAEAARYAEARAADDFDTAAVIAGEAVDLIVDLPPAGELVARMADQAASLLAGASRRYRLAQPS